MFDSEKFKKELRLLGISLKELYDRSGLNYSHLSNLKNGKIKDVKLETIIQLAQHLNKIPPYRLLKDTVINIVNQKIRDDISRLNKDNWLHYLESTILSEDIGKHIPPQRFPIIGKVYANGENNLPENLESALRSESNEFIAFENIDDPKAFAVRMNDPDISHIFREGTIVFFSSAEKPNSKGINLIQETNGKCRIRDAIRINDSFVLLDRNPTTSPIKLNKNQILSISYYLGHLTTI